MGQNMRRPRLHRYWIRLTTPFMVWLALSGSSSMLPPPGADGFYHQPANYPQMKALVTPDDPEVVWALVQALDSTAPDMPSPTDFDNIVAWVNRRFIYQSDEQLHGVEDYWQTPRETLASGKGDCEDYSILLCSILRAHRVSADEVYAVVGRYGGRWHSWLVEKYSTGMWRLHDSSPAAGTQGLALDSPAAASFDASYSFNDQTGFNGHPT